MVEGIAWKAAQQRQRGMNIVLARRSTKGKIRSMDGFKTYASRANYPRQADPRITAQKFPRLNEGSLSARTSAFTLPNVVCGLCLMPS